MSSMTSLFSHLMQTWLDFQQDIINTEQSKLSIRH